MISGFYSKVMALPTRKVGAKQVKKKKKLRGKGRSQRVRKVRKGKGRYLDVFRVVFDAESGEGGSSRKQNSFFEEHLSELSESQLKRLKEKVEQVRKRLLEGSEEYRRISEADDFIKKAIDRRLQRSHFLTSDLQKAIRKKLKTLKGIEGVAEGEALVEIVHEGDIYSPSRFARKFFRTEIDLFDRLLSEHKIIPKRVNETGAGFVTRQIKKLFLAF